MERAPSATILARAPQRRLALAPALQAAPPAALPPLEAGLLRRLAAGPCSLAELIVPEDGAHGTTGAVLLALAALATEGMVEEWLIDGSGKVVATLTRPRIGVFARTADALGEIGWRCAAHLFMLPVAGGFEVACPGLACVLRSSCAALPGLLAGAGAPPPAHPPEAALLHSLLADNGFLVPADAAPDDGSDTLSWAFHDALFHSVSSRGQDGIGYGATYPWRGRRAMPARADEGDAPCPRIGLPAAPAPEEGGPGFARVLGARRSVRAYAARPLDPAALGALLDMALRARGTAMAADGPMFLHAYPSGGAKGEIAAFLVLAQDGGLRPDVYRYDSLAHALCPVAAGEGAASAAVGQLARASGCAPTAPAALVLAADYGPMAWKYECIAYATILRNVGCIYQTVALCAASLGLGACPLGGGWAGLEDTALGAALGARVIVGAMLLGWPDVQ